MNEAELEVWMDNQRLLELLAEVLDEGCVLPEWLDAAIRAEIEEAGGFSQSAVDQAYRRVAQGAGQLPMEGR